MNFVMNYFQRQWLDILEETKKKKTATDNQRKESSSSDRASQRLSTISSRASTYSYDPTNRKIILLTFDSVLPF